MSADNIITEDSDMVVLRHNGGEERIIRPLSAVMGLWMLIGGTKMLLVEGCPDARSVMRVFIAAFFFVLCLTCACLGYGSRVIIDSKGITEFTKFFFWSREKQILTPWNCIHQIFVYEQGMFEGALGNPRYFRQHGVFEKAIVRQKDGKLYEKSLSWHNYDGDWTKAVEIIRKNLPDYSIGNREEYHRRYG